MWKKLRLDSNGQNISAATALILLAIDELSEKGEKGTYGYEIMAHVHTAYNWAVKSGTVYPILKKLNTDGLIRIEFRPVPSNRNQTYYIMTPKGKKLVEQIKTLNDSALEEAFDTNPEKKIIESPPEKLRPVEDHFILEKFSDSVLRPFLNELNKQILGRLSDSITPPDLDQSEVELEKAIEDLEAYKLLLKSHINTINSMKKFKD